jgi:2-keto-4-pentenoate hydratase/2-oxohepta-3-ene-1,7-dioic acid hydratase in catechol pathway
MHGSPRGDPLKIVRYLDDAGRPAWGIGEGDGVFAATGSSIGDLEPAAQVGQLQELTLLAPTAPGQIVCVGRNYRAHAEEMGKPIGDEPVLFLKPPSSVIGPGGSIVCPRMSSRVDHEAELAVVISRTAHKISAADAPSVIAGYTCANDVTARDLQQADGYWVRGKGFPTFCPLGPWIETEVDASDVVVRCDVNGRLRQEGSTADLVFGIPYLVQFITAFLRLEPGDVILTGTPAGIGPIEPGQVVTVDIEGIGALSNPVVAEESTGAVP